MQVTTDSYLYCYLDTISVTVIEIASREVVQTLQLPPEFANNADNCKLFNINEQLHLVCKNGKLIYSQKLEVSLGTTTRYGWKNALGWDIKLLSF